MDSLVEHFDAVSLMFIGMISSLGIIVAWAIKRTLSNIDENLTRLNAVLLDHEHRLSHIEGRMEANA